MAFNKLIFDLIEKENLTELVKISTCPALQLARVRILAVIYVLNTSS